MKVFAEAAKKLTHNPLGVIGLFLVLIYGFASLVTSAGRLLPAERWPLIWFLVVFPPLLLGAFIWLVIGHHTKLYAPMDFRSDEAFLRPQTPQEQRERIESEAGPLPSSTQPAEPPPETVESRDHLSERRTALSQRHRRLINQVLIEDLVLRDLQLRYPKPLSRRVAVGSSGPRLQVDAAVRDGDAIHVIEIFRVNERVDLRSRVRDFLARTEPVAQELLQSGPPYIFKVIAAVVVEGEGLSPERVATELQDLIAHLSFPFELVTYKQADLLSRYDLGRDA